MALLLLLFGGFWAQVVSPQSVENMTSLPTALTPKGFSIPLASGVTEALNLSSDASTEPVKGGPQEADSAGSEISATFRATELSPLGTPTGASTGPPIPEPTASQEVSPTKPPVLPETSNTTSDPAVLIAVNSLGDSVSGGENMTSDSLETVSVTHGPPVVMATSSPAISSETHGPPVVMATSSPAISSETHGPSVVMATGSLAISSETHGPSVVMATSSLESSHETSGPPVTMTTSFLEISNETHGPPVTMATGSGELSSETSGPTVTTAFGSGEPPSVASSSPVSSLETSMTTTAALSASTSSGSTLHLDQKPKGKLLVPLLVALLVVTVLLALLLLWRQRQKRRTGALTLTRGGKRNGVVDAWAGPARVPDEEAVTTAGGGSGVDKGSGVPETEEPGQRPTLTTFFGRRKSRQGSVALEELKSGPGLKGEEEPLVGSETEAVEASTGPEAGDGAVPQSL